MNKFTLFEKYVVGATIYGYSRKAFKIKNAQYETYKRKSDVVVTLPVPYTDKIVTSCIHGLVAPYFLPIFVIHDMRDIEIWWRGLPEELLLKREKYYNMSDLVMSI